VFVKPKPLVVVLVFCWSMLGAFSRMTSPGLVIRSTFVATPIWKSFCVVSVRQPLVAAAVSEKFRVVVVLSITTMLEAVLELKPASLAVMLGYVPAGIPLNE
jgi:hypothetical protein